MGLLSEIMINCLGYKCAHARYENERQDTGETFTVLWCGVSETAVFDLAACPDGWWIKEEDRIGLPDGRQGA